MFSVSNSMSLQISINQKLELHLKCLIRNQRKLFNFFNFYWKKLVFLLLFWLFHRIFYHLWNWKLVRFWLDSWLNCWGIISILCLVLLSLLLVGLLRILLDRLMILANDGLLCCAFDLKFMNILDFYFVQTL